MKDIIKNFMKLVANQLKMIVYQENEGVIYNDNANLWIIAIRVMKPICGSFEIKLTHPKNEAIPILSLEIYCEKNAKFVSDIFDNVVKLIDNKVYNVNKSENLIALHWHVNLNSINEAEIDFIKFSRILPRILIILKDLGLFQLKSFDSIVNSTTDKYFKNYRKKNITEKANKNYLIIGYRPTVNPHFKSYYYF